MLPSESILRKKYLETVVDKKKTKMIDLLKNEKFYIIFDETENKKMENAAEVERLFSVVL